MLRISKLTDYATVILARLASQPDRRFTAARLAAETRLAGPTVSKLLKQLHRRALVQSTRGLHGGYLLARPASQITAAHILDALEGPVALTECASSESHCCIESTCLVSKAWQRVNLAVRRSLQEITLTELAGLSAHAGAAADRATERAGERVIAAPTALAAVRSAKREPL